MLLEIKDKTFPNGKPYKEVSYNHERLGAYSIEAEGYLPFGKRKPRKSEFEAIVDVIGDKEREAEKQIAMLDRARDEAYERQHEWTK